MEIFAYGIIVTHFLDANPLTRPRATTMSLALQICATRLPVRVQTPVFPLGLRILVVHRGPVRMILSVLDAMTTITTDMEIQQTKTVAIPNWRKQPSNGLASEVTP